VGAILGVALMIPLAKIGERRAAEFARAEGGGQLRPFYLTDFLLCLGCLGLPDAVLFGALGAFIGRLLTRGGRDGGDREPRGP
jgi:hypothetical protein